MFHLRCCSFIVLCTVLLDFAQLCTCATVAANNSVTQIFAAGATFPEELYMDAMFAYQFVDPTVSMSYLPTGSGGGKNRIMLGDKMKDDGFGPPFNIDFAGSDSLLKPDQYSQYPDLQMYPSVAGAVVPIYNIPELEERSLDLILKPETVAKIFSGEIKYWNDTAIQRDNEDGGNQVGAQVLAKIKSAIIVFVRNEDSGTTEIWKKSLAGADAFFKKQIGTSSKPVWNSTARYEFRDENNGVASGVLATDYSIGYSVLGVALKLKLKSAMIIKPGSTTPIRASAAAVEFAVAEMGLDFGNNDDPPERLTANVMNAQGSLAWPMVGYTYLVMRKDTLRTGATCLNRKATVNFWIWFHTSEVARNLARSHGFAPLPEIVQNTVLTRLKSDIKCGGVVAYDNNNVKVIDGHTIPVVFSTLGILGNTYIGVDPSVTFNMYEESKSTDAYNNMLSQRGGFAVVRSGSKPAWASSISNLIIPLAGVGYGLIYNLCGDATKAASCDTTTEKLVVDGKTLAQLLKTSKPTFGALKTLNPSMNTKLVNQEMYMICPEVGSEDRAIMTEILASFDSGFTENSWQCQTSLSNSPFMGVLGEKRFAVGFGPLNDIPSTVQVADFQSTSGKKVSYSVDAVLRCAKATTMNSYGAYELPKGSVDEGCYPLSEGFNVIANKAFALTDKKNEDCGTSDPAVAMTLFIGWMYGHPKAVGKFTNVNYSLPLIKANLAPLGFDQDLKAHNILNSFKCNGKSILDPPKPSASITAFITAAAFASIILLFLSSLMWAFKSGKIDFDKLVATIFSEEICLMADMIVNVSDVTTFTMSVFILVAKREELVDLFPICILFIILGWISTFHNLRLTFNHFRHIIIQKDASKNDIFVRKHAEAATNASFETRKPSLTNWSKVVPASPHNDETKQEVSKRLSQAFSLIRTNSHEAGAISHIDIIENLQRARERLRGDLFLILFEALPTMVISIKVNMTLSTTSIINVMSLVVSTSVFGAKSAGLGSYPVVVGDLKREKSRLHNEIISKVLSEVYEGDGTPKNDEVVSVKVTPIDDKVDVLQMESEGEHRVGWN